MSDLQGRHGPLYAIQRAIIVYRLSLKRDSNLDNALSEDSSWRETQLMAPATCFCSNWDNGHCFLKRPTLVHSWCFTCQFVLYNGVSKQLLAFLPGETYQGTTSGTKHIFTSASGFKWKWIVPIPPFTPILHSLTSISCPHTT